MSGNIEAVDQAKILRRSLESSENQTVLDTLMLSSEVERVNESKLLFGVLDILKGLDLRKSDSRKQFAELLNLCDVGDNETENDDFLKWLSKRIDKGHFNVVKSSPVKHRDKRKKKNKMLRFIKLSLAHDMNIPLLPSIDKMEEIR